MNKQELISIIVPVYNVERFLPKCIDSLINQTYSNLEIILVDDGSLDNSKQICDAYSKMDNRIIVIHKINGGLSEARNYGIKKAKGEYIALIDSDDYISNNYIEYLYSALKEYNADVSVSQYLYVDENDFFMSTRKLSHDYCVDSNYECMEDFMKNDYIGTMAWGKLYKKTLFKDVIYPIGKYHEDVYTTYLIIAKCNKIFVGKQQNYYYRQREASITNQTFNEKHLDTVFANLERKQYIDLYYSDLSKYASAMVIYACNQCALKMIKTNNNNLREHIKFLQKQYRKYEVYFLRGTSSLKAKAFSILAFINLKDLINIGNYFFYKVINK